VPIFIQHLLLVCLAHKIYASLDDFINILHSTQIYADYVHLNLECPVCVS